ncbi:hypothetical protein GQ464_017090 [Rhodocaloribacter litoris]|uniref:hypothetical protein n=1 Tax=Rhodocaloribacter litoris TaxID=2558931 RepID=UPI001420647D|nr:hypothetical protein [Rhodocaloribacter litoris]QXD15098.1 hypothetical protein GQ464_017090 [Rhodocaloribacter litoris]
MFEIVVLLIGAFPFLVGLYAIKMMRQSDDDDADDQPPPPDPGPPLPVSPQTPRRHDRLRPAAPDREAVAHRRLTTPARHPRIPR